MNVSRTMPAEGTCQGKKKKKMKKKKIKFPRIPRRTGSQGQGMMGVGKGLLKAEKRNSWSSWRKRESLKKPRRRKPNQLSEREKFSTPGAPLRALALHPRGAQCPSPWCHRHPSRHHKPVEVRGRCHEASAHSRWRARKPHKGWIPRSPNRKVSPRATTSSVSTWNPRTQT